MVTVYAIAAAVGMWIGQKLLIRFRSRRCTVQVLSAWAAYSRVTKRLVVKPCPD